MSSQHSTGVPAHQMISSHDHPRLVNYYADHVQERGRKRSSGSSRPNCMRNTRARRKGRHGAASRSLLDHCAELPQGGG